MATAWQRWGPRPSVMGMQTASGTAENGRAGGGFRYLGGKILNFSPLAPKYRHIAMPPEHSTRTGRSSGRKCDCAENDNKEGTYVSSSAECLRHFSARTCHAADCNHGSTSHGSTNRGS